MKRLVLIAAVVGLAITPSSATASPVSLRAATTRLSADARAKGGRSWRIECERASPITVSCLTRYRGIPRFYWGRFHRPGTLIARTRVALRHYRVVLIPMAYSFTVWH